MWAEPRPAGPPVRVWRDWAVVAVLVTSSFVEMLLREDKAWAPLVVGVSVVVAACLLWRRTRPLVAVAAAFGTLLAFDIARIVAVDATGLNSIAGVLVLPYALLRPVLGHAGRGSPLPHRQPRPRDRAGAVAVANRARPRAP